jgi:hypothetical protein
MGLEVDTGERLVGNAVLDHSKALRNRLNLLKATIERLRSGDLSIAEASFVVLAPHDRMEAFIEQRKRFRSVE